MPRQNLDPRIKVWADKIYASDRQKFERIAGWIKAAERTYEVTVIAGALERFVPYAIECRDWWPYLDQLLDKEEGRHNARNAEVESERHKLEDKEVASDVLKRFGLGTKAD